LAVTQLGGVQQDIAQVLAISPRATVKDYEDIIARLKAAPELIAQTIDLLKEGLEKKITPPRITLRDVPQQIKEQMVEDPEKSALLNPFFEFTREIPEDSRSRLKGEAETVVKDKVIPAYGGLYDFFTKTYEPNTRESIALSDLPDGKAWYAFSVRSSTTTSLT